jgi:hypothetical protein
MKKIIFLLAFLIPVLVFGQTRIRDLTNQATYDGSVYVPVDKAGYTTTKKMQLSVIAAYINGLRATNDTTTRRGVGLADSGNYINDAGTNYLTSALMAGYDTNSVMTAIHMIDSILYSYNLRTALWDTGSVSTATKRATANNTSVGAYSMSNNGYTVGLGAYGTSFGYKSVARLPKSIALSGGTYMTDYGANQTELFIAYGESKAGASDTLEISELYPLTIPTDAVIGFEITIVGVQKAGATAVVGSGFYQKWNGCIRNDAGTTSFIGTPDSTTAKRSAGELSIVTLIADNTLDQLDITVVSGAGSIDCEYTAYVRFIYMGYRNFTLGY